MAWLFGPPNIEKLSKKGDIKGLVKALIHQTVSVRQEAAVALCKIGQQQGVDCLIELGEWDRLIEIGKPAVACLIAAMKDTPNNYNRLRIARTLVKMGCNPSDTPEMIDCLIELGEWDRLIEIGKPAVACLIAAMKDTPNNYNRLHIARTLMKIGIAWEEFADIVEQAVLFLVADIEKGMQNFGECIEALGWRGNKIAIDPLISLLNAAYLSDEYGTYSKEYGTEDKICAIARVLGRIGEPQAFLPLLSLLEFRNHSGSYGPAERVRSAAVWALGEIGDNNAVEPLITVFKNNPCNREDVVDALIKIGISQEVKNTLITTLISDHRSGKSYAAVCLELLGWKPESEKDRINNYLAKKDISGLKKIGQPAIKHMIYLFKQIPASEYLASSSDFGSIILMCLSKMDDETAKKLIMKELKGRGQFCKIARDLINSGDSSEDHCLCPKCFTYLGIRKESVAHGKTITTQTREEAKQRGIAIIGAGAYYRCPTCGDSILV